MNLLEWQGKEIFKARGIPVPEGKVCYTAGEAAAKAAGLGGRVVVKAQVQAGGRGKAGGVALVEGAEQAKREAERILKLTIKNLPVKAVLVERAVDIAQELYMGLVLDRGKKSVCLLFSAEGGMEIEELAKKKPGKLRRVWLPRSGGFLGQALRQAVMGTGLSPEAAKQAVSIGLKLIALYEELDCTLAEINPMVITRNGEVIAADSKIVLDDNALDRHKDFAEQAAREGQGTPEWLAKEKGLSFIPLDGDIGCVVNGAGLAMATMDLVKYFGGQPANFLDVGGSSNPDKVVTALKILQGQGGVKSVLFNIFGGITRCDDVAKGLLIGLEQTGITLPIVVRLTGTNEILGRKILKDAKTPLIIADTMSEAVKKAVEAAK